jgi:sorbitol/mannitol transport system substrate-binding protein
MRLPHRRATHDPGRAARGRRLAGRTATGRGARTVAVATALLMATTACTAGAGGKSDSGRSINVLMVNNPQMVDLQRLTAENFTAETGIVVNYTVLPENDLRDKVSQEFTSQANQYDVATLSNFEIPIYAGNDWLYPLDDFIAQDSEFDQDDIFPSMTESLSADGTVYGEPFYGESSFLMYRKDVFEEKGLEMPERPTWQQVAELAAQVDYAQPDMRGICLRGQPGWGQVIAPLTTVVNTFGGTWFTADWQAQVNAPEFTEATEFYVNLVQQHGEFGAPSAGFTECLTALAQGKVAMWYDATSAAGSLEAEDSPVKGKLGYVQAPVEKTEASGWLYAWSWAIEKSTPKSADAWEFISWASGKDYENLVGEQLGWARVPAGKRASTYEIPQYVEAAKAFAEPTRTAITEADPTDPGVQPRPTVGIQFVDIPEFTNLGTKVSQDISSAIAGQISVTDALNKGQELAEKVAATYRQ